VAAADVNRGRAVPPVPPFAARRFVRRAHELLGDAEPLLPLQLLLTPEPARDRWPTPATDLVVEGFVRSGNTFAVEAFRAAQPGPVRVASHVHLPAQLRRAVRLGLPTIVVVRRPADAVVSQVIWSPHVQPRSALRYWVHYYSEVLRFGPAVVIAPFERVTTDFGSVVEAVNHRFGTRFTPFRHTPAAVEAVFAAIEEREHRLRRSHTMAQTVSRTDESRSEAKAAVASRLGEPDLAPLVAATDAMHRAIVATAEALFS
jgi:hypothetical protein